MISEYHDRPIAVGQGVRRFNEGGSYLLNLISKVWRILVRRN